MTSNLSMEMEDVLDARPDLAGDVFDEGQTLKYLKSFQQ